MTALARLSRRALAGVLGLAVAAPAAMAVPVDRMTAEDHLVAIRRRLWLLEDELRQLPPDPSDVVLAAILDRIDATLAEAALVKPDTPLAFGHKAGIVLTYGDDCPAGEMVHRYLLCDLMMRGGVEA